MIPILELVRLEEDWKAGTFGILKFNKEVFCCTLEPRDEENRVNISSIPAQQYWCRRYSSMKYPDTFQVCDVPMRDKILFHSGNFSEQTEGCILLGESFGKLKGERGILNSGNTFLAWMKRLDNIREFHLTIHEAF